jgi:hypothetical protein
MRELARGLIRDSAIEDAIAEKIAQFIEFIHDDRIKPLQQRVEMLERERALDEIVAMEENTPKKQVHWANDYGDGIEFWHDSREAADGWSEYDRTAVIRREQIGDKIEYYKEDV